MSGKEGRRGQGRGREGQGVGEEERRGEAWRGEGKGEEGVEEMQGGGEERIVVSTYIFL